MENTLLYFYSTIPQVLAASIALVFIFIIFKLQEFDKKINIQCLDFAGILGNNSTGGIDWQRLQTSGKFMTNYKAGYFKGISDIMDTICSEREHEKKQLLNN